MRNFPTVEELAAMPISRLRTLDIQSSNEEALVQIVINEKVKAAPVEVPQLVIHEDIRTKEDELAWQAKVDERNERLRPKEISVALDGLEEDLPLGPPLDYTNNTPNEPISIPVDASEEVAVDVPIEIVVDPELEELEEIPQELQAKAPGCEECGSKGRRHKKGCVFEKKK